MTDPDDLELSINRDLLAEVLARVTEADVLVDLLRAAHATAGANSITFVVTDD